MGNPDDLSSSEGYLDQVTANVARARQYLAEAEQRTADRPLCSSALARALEHAACAVFVAWGEPCKAGWKIHRRFEERLAPHIGSSLVLFVSALWSLEGSGRVDVAGQVIAACRRIIDSFERLAVDPPPAGWQPLPIPEPVGWNALADDERSFLQAAVRTAREACPEVRLLLFGSRAAGTAEPTSDYDLLFIFPAAFRDYGYSIGPVVSLAMRQGIAVDTERIDERQWSNPPQSRRPVVNRIKACHMEVLEN